MAPSPTYAQPSLLLTSSSERKQTSHAPSLTLGLLLDAVSPMSLPKCVKAWCRVPAIVSKYSHPQGQSLVSLLQQDTWQKVTNRRKVWLASQFEEASVAGPWGSWSHSVHHLKAGGVNVGGQATLSWGCLKLRCVFSCLTGKSLANKPRSCLFGDSRSRQAVSQHSPSHHPTVFPAQPVHCPFP